MVETIVTVIFALDLFFNFFIPYSDKDGKIVRNHGSIAKNYASGIVPEGLVIDFVATFPF